jgi:hypothetical protein
MYNKEYQREYRKTHKEKFRQYASKYRAKNREKYNARILEWIRKHPEYKQKQLLLIKKSREKNKEKYAQYQLGYYYRNLVKALCRAKANDKIYRGVIKKQPCELCGKVKVEAHHNDYNKPYKITWLCKYHHTQHHLLIN